MAPIVSYCRKTIMNFQMDNRFKSIKMPDNPIKHLLKSYLKG